MRPQARIGKRLNCPGTCLPIWFLLAGLPVLTLTGLVVVKLFTGDIPQPLAVLIPSGRRLPLFLQTVVFAGVVGLFCTIVAFFSALAVHLGNRRIVQSLAFAILPMAVLPPHIHALAWGTAIRDLNGVLRLMNWALLPEQGFLISAWVQSMALLPLGFGMLYLGFKTLPADMAEAAIVLGTSGKTTLRILLPLQAPNLSASFLLLFLFSLLDYSVPSIFQLNLYTLTIFSEFSIRYDATHAFLLSMPLLAISLPAAWGLQAALQRVPLAPAGHAKTGFTLPTHTTLRIPMAVAMTIALLQVFSPLLTLLGNAGASFADPRWILDAVPDFRGTLFTGLLAAGIALPFTWAAADAIHVKKAGHQLWWLLMILPLSLPAPLIGIGLIQVWNSTALRWTGLYTSMFMPALASVLRFLPLGVLLLVSAMKRMDPTLLEAALILQRSPVQGLLKIRLPLLGSALAGAGLLAAVLSFGELGATLLLLPPGAGSLTIKIYNYLHYGQSDVVAGLCLFLYLVALGIGAGLMRLFLPKGAVPLKPTVPTLSSAPLALRLPKKSSRSMAKK